METYHKTQITFLVRDTTRLTVGRLLVILEPFNKNEETLSKTCRQLYPTEYPKETLLIHFIIYVSWIISKTTYCPRVIFTVQKIVPERCWGEEEDHIF